jgi:hypothetical protein
MGDFDLSYNSSTTALSLLKVKDETLGPMTFNSDIVPSGDIDSHTEQSDSSGKRRKAGFIRSEQGSQLKASKPGERKIFAAIAALAFLSGLFYFLYFQNHYQPDSRSYIVPANRLLDGKGFTDSSGAPETIRTPGYPLLIMPFLMARLDLRYLILFQHLLRLLLVLATTRFALRLSGSRRIAVVTGILMCMDLPLLESANAVLTEMSFAAVLALALYVLWRITDRSASPVFGALLAGMLAGTTVLIRPVSILLFAPICIFILLAETEDKFRTIVAFTAAFLLLPTLWSARNYRETGQFTISAIGGFNMLDYRAAGVLAINDPGTFTDNFERRRAEMEALACRQLKQNSNRECANMPATEKSKYYWQLGQSIVRQHPGAYLKLALRGAAEVMLDGGTDTLAQVTGIMPHRGVRILMAYTFPLFCLSLLGLASWWEAERNFFWLAALVILYFVVISAGAEAYSRFRVPVVPIYVILSATGLDAVIRRLQRHQGHRSAKRGAVGLL